MKNLLVTNRDGETEYLDINKIRKKAKKAVFGLKNVSSDELESSLSIELFSGIKTMDIHKSLIATAVNKIDIDRPDWTFVASRLYIESNYHRVGKLYSNKKGEPYPNLKEVIEYGIEIGKFHDSLLSYSNEEFEELNNIIQSNIKDIEGSKYHKKDYQFNYLGIKTFFDRYVVRNSDGEPIELPQLAFMRIAMFLAQNEKNKMHWAKIFYEKISTFKIMLATPTLSNAGTIRHQLSSCYVTSTPDNIEGIFDIYKEHALLSKYGGGIGADWNLVRAMMSYIDGHKEAAGGVIPFLKIENDIAIAVDQLGTRKGAIAVYIEPWNKNITDFLDLKKNSGEERRRAHDLFPALWINDLFMKRAQANEDWTLFDPYEVNLSNLYGDEFESEYLRLEADPTINKETINAKDLWKKMLTQYFETGSPFFCFKDNANRANPNAHNGIIRSSNLCTEIFQNTSPQELKIKIEFKDGSHSLFNEDEKIITDNGSKKEAKKITAIDKIFGKEISFVSKTLIEGETAVCNLGSINLSKVYTKEEINETVPVLVRILDNVIDLNLYPSKKAMETNKKTRAIGIGVMGEAQMLAESQIMWGSQEHFEKIDQIMEYISYTVINTSSDLAKEKGTYDLFNGSNWSKGILPIDKANQETLELTNRELSEDWDSLRNKVINNGMRNGYLMAIAPTSSISILVGTTQAIEPIFKKKWLEDNMSGIIPVCAPNISAKTWQYYPSAYDINQVLVVKAAAIRQKWIDQGQSLNIFIRTDKASGKYFNEIYTTAWKLGVKSTYYLRAQSPEMTDESTVEDRSIECYGCQ